MPAFRGRDVVVTFNAVDISGDGRSTSYEQTADILDDTTYGADDRTKQGGLRDGSGSMEALDTSGNWSAAWDEIIPGTSATMIIYPEGNATGERRLSFTAVIGNRSVTWPYDDLATLSMSFEISGGVTEDLVP